MAGKGQGFTRRQALRSSMMTGLAAAVGASTRAVAEPATQPAGTTTRPAGADVRNIIFMVADGMSVGVPSMAELFSRTVRTSGTNWYELQQDPRTVRGYFETHSLSSVVTDSSAASSAWGSGSRVFNGAVNKLPDGTKLTPLATLVKDARRRMGLVTTTTITHATPAGFAVVEKSRGSEDEIAEQYLDTVDVLMGGGIEFFKADRRKDEKDLIEAYEDKGYVHWDHRRQLPTANPPDKILGLFEEGHLSYALDRQNQEKLADQVPTLAEMARVALESLASGPNGFLLQIEGGRVDHAAHTNDAAALMWEQLGFDDAIGVVRQFAAAHPDTLVVITTDHGNGNPGLRGMGNNYVDSMECLARLAGAKASFDVILKALRKAGRESGATTDTAVGLIREYYGLQLKDKEADTVAAIMKGKLPYEASAQHANAQGLLGEVLGNHTGVAFLGINHTEDLAPVLAFGAGSEQFAGLMPNTEAFHKITAAFGIQHRNPSMTAARAKTFMTALPQDSSVHWV